MLVDGIGLTVDDKFAFVGADFHAVTSSSSLHSFSDLLELFAASQQIDVVSKGAWSLLP